MHRIIHIYIIYICGCLPLFCYPTKPSCGRTPRWWRRGARRLLEVCGWVYMYRIMNEVLSSLCPSSSRRVRDVLPHTPRPQTPTPTTTAGGGGGEQQDTTGLGTSARGLAPPPSSSSSPPPSLLEAYRPHPQQRRPRGPSLFDSGGGGSAGASSLGVGLGVSAASQQQLPLYHLSIPRCDSVFGLFLWFCGGH